MEADRFRNQEGRLWLNVACSRSVLPGFVNLDNSIYLRMLPFASWVRPFLNAGHREWLDSFREAAARVRLVRHDCREALPFPDDCAEHVLCSHFLEHVHPSEAQTILGDFHRVLRPGGTLHVIVPDLAVLVEQYLKQTGARWDAADQLVRETMLSRESRGSFRFRLMEFWGEFGLNHRWMYDAASISRRVADAGFELLEENETPSVAYRRDDGVSVHVVGRKP